MKRIPLTQSFDEAATVQALDYLACRAPGRTITKLVALKLLYLADRYHLRKYGRTILGDNYRAMRYGPVAMRTLRLIERLARSGRDESGTVAVEKLPGKRLGIRALQTPDIGKLSDSEVEALDCALRQLFLHADIVEFTHQFPEWKKHQAALDQGAKSVRMDLIDFFLPCEVPGVEYCPASPRHVSLSRELYREESQWFL